MSFFISFTHTKQIIIPASSCPFLVRSGHFVIVNKPKLCPNKEMKGQVELDWD